MSNTEKKTVSWFEKKFVFSITRIFALCGAAAIVISIVVLAMKLFEPSERKTVTYEEVSMVLSVKMDDTQSDAEGSPTAPSVAAIPIPDDLKPYFGEEKERILRAWIDDLSEDQQKDFLKNMSRVMREAKINKVDVTEAINAYKSLKLQKLSSEGFEQYTEMADKAGYIAAIFGLLLILSVLSLVLVMLAIERNTRSPSA